VLKWYVVFSNSMDDLCKKEWTTHLKCLLLHKQIWQRYTRHVDSQKLKAQVIKFISKKLPQHNFYKLPFPFPPLQFSPFALLGQQVQKHCLLSTLAKILFRPNLQIVSKKKAATFIVSCYFTF
jgi:hypothetical protein